MGLRRHLAGLFTVGVLALTGCGKGDGLPREPISGTVTFGGEPLKSGSIQLYPATEAEGIASGGIISDGKFKVDREAGPVPGNYTVMIFSTPDGSAPAEAPAEDEMPGEIKATPRRRAGVIPVRYNFQTELRAEVKAGGPNTYTFALEKSNKK